MRSSQNHRRRSPTLMRLQPSRRAKTPPVARLQPNKATSWSRKVIPSRTAELQKFSGHPRANHMHAKVILTRLAISVSIEPRHGIATANFQRQAKHIQRSSMKAISMAVAIRHTSPTHRKTACK